MRHGWTNLKKIETDCLGGTICLTQIKLWFCNRPFSSSPGSLFQNEGRCSAFDMETIFHFHANKTHFHKKGCAPSLILKQRPGRTPKWPIQKQFLNLVPYRIRTRDLYLLTITQHLKVQTWPRVHKIDRILLVSKCIYFFQFSLNNGFFSLNSLPTLKAPPC